MTGDKPTAQADLDALKRRILTVQVRPARFSQRMLGMAAYFGILVLSVGLSRVWFGGSWVIDIICLAAAIVAATIVGRPRMGSMVRMTPSQLREWVDAGCPDTWPEGFDLRD